MRTIKEGDTVDFFWSDGSRHEGCTVMHTACATGDLWYLKDPDGYEWAVNTGAIDFLCFKKVDKELDAKLKKADDQALDDAFGAKGV